MSCPEFSYTSRGRQGIGVSQPQSGLDYPFVAPSTDIQNLLADFYLAYDDPSEYSVADARVPPLRIEYLLNIGCDDTGVPENLQNVSGPQIRVVDTTGAVVFDTISMAATVDVDTSNEDYTIYTWTTDHAVCRTAVYTTWKTGTPAAIHYPKYLAPVSAVLNARTIHKLPRRLLSLSVRQQGSPLKAGPYIGNVLLKNNYNTEITAGTTQTNNFIVNTNITLTAGAGIGAGYFYVCGQGYDELDAPPQPIRLINGVAAKPGGDFLLAANDCLYARLPTTVAAGKFTPSTAAQQQIGSDCSACCTCADYVNAALSVNNVGENYRRIGARANEVLNVYKDNVAKWAALRECSANNPLKLIFVPQCCPTLDVVAMICNPCQTCYPASTLNIVFNRSVELLCGHTTLYLGGKTSNVGIAVSGGGTTLGVSMPAVEAGGSTYVKFRVSANAAAGNFIQGTLTGTFDDNSPIHTACPEDVDSPTGVLAVAQTSATLNCDQTGNDTRCEQ